MMMTTIMMMCLTASADGAGVQQNAGDQPRTARKDQPHPQRAEDLQRAVLSRRASTQHLQEAESRRPPVCAAGTRTPVFAYFYVLFGFRFFVDICLCLSHI